MRDLQQEGKMLHVGVCNVTVEQLAIARSIVEIATVQSPFNLPDTSRTDLLTECEAHGMGFMPYRPLAGRNPRRARRTGRIGGRTPRCDARAGRARVAALAIAGHPIPGTTSVAHLEENVAAASLRLDDGEVHAIGSAAG